ncbi:MAG: calcium/sodium antiporter [Candidatus Methanofastidiosia archaeon]
MFMEIILVALGFVLLVKGADFLIRGASSIATRLGVSSFVIGLTIVAFGTSMPEFGVNFASALKGTTDIAFGNIIGSNMANILLIVGVTSIILPLKINSSAKVRDIPYALVSAIILLILVNDKFMFGASHNGIGMWDGIILVAFFFYFLYFVLRSSRDNVSEEGFSSIPMEIWKASLFIIGGIAGLYLGGDLIVDNAVKIAKSLYISDILISSTLVAFGTSLPELATSLVAAFKKNSDLAIGNIVGSNIFNILWVLGVTSIIRFIPLSAFLNIDIFLVILATLLLLFFSYAGKKNVISRWEGVVMLLFYICYIVMLVTRG